MIFHKSFLTALLISIPTIPPNPVPTGIGVRKYRFTPDDMNGAIGDSLRVEDNYFIRI